MSDIKLSPEAKSLKLGLEELVVYKALYGEGLTWVRPLKMFLETVEINGKKKPRFQFVKQL